MSKGIFKFFETYWRIMYLWITTTTLLETISPIINYVQNYIKFLKNNGYILAVVSQILNTIYNQVVNNLFVTSKNETMNSPIHEFKVLHKGLLKPLFSVSYLKKKHFKPYFFILKALKDILKHFESVNWCFRFLMSRTGYRIQITKLPE